MYQKRPIQPKILDVLEIIYNTPKQKYQKRPIKPQNNRCARIKEVTDVLEKIYNTLPKYDV